MSRLPSLVEEWIQDSSSRILSTSARPQRIRLIDTVSRPAANIFILAVDTAVETHSICVKQFCDTNSVDGLIDRAEYMSPILKEHGLRFPEVLGSSKELSTIAMSVMPGKPLESLIVSSFFRGKKYQSKCENAVRSAARHVRQLNQISIPSDAPMAKPCSNSEYIRRLEEHALADEFVCSSLGGANLAPATVYDQLPKDFNQRLQHQALHGDCQAKNFLVDDDGTVCMIDIEYGSGHPMRDVAHFIVQLDRLTRRWRFRHARSRLRALSDVFVDEYRDASTQDLTNDLPFFKLWSLAFSLKSDARSNPLIRQIVRFDLKSNSFFQDAAQP